MGNTHRFKYTHAGSGEGEKENIKHLGYALSALPLEERTPNVFLLFPSSHRWSSKGKADCAGFLFDILHWSITSQLLSRVQRPWLVLPYLTSLDPTQGLRHILHTQTVRVSEGGDSIRVCQEVIRLEGRC